MHKIALAIHGGAGTILKERMTPNKEVEYKAALAQALDAGYKVLMESGDALDAVEVAVRELEDSPLFNAGKGSVFTHEGKHEMDASIMEGKNLNAGAVSMITGIKNPISLARDVMDKSEHVFLAAEGAMQFAKLHGYALEEPDYFYDELRYKQWIKVRETERASLDHDTYVDEKFGTVGAVACDINGNLAAATSTGGLTNKRWGRVGDSPIIGSGNYANNNTCAVSCTGSGEYFIRGVVAYDVSCLMEYRGMSLQEAADEVIHNRIMKIGGDGGLIAVDTAGNIALPFNTAGMYRAWRISENEKNAISDEGILIYK